MMWDPRSKRRPRSRNFRKDQSWKKTYRSARTTGLALSREASHGAF